MAEGTQPVIVQGENGKLQVQGESAEYYLGELRSVTVRAENIRRLTTLTTHGRRERIVAKGTLDDSVSPWISPRGEREKLQVIGYPETAATTVSLSIQKAENTDASGTLSADIGFMPANWEVGNKDEWYLQLNLTEESFNVFVEALEKGAITTAFGSASFKMDTYHEKLDVHAPPSMGVTHYFRPEHSGSFGITGETEGFNFYQSYGPIRDMVASAPPKGSEEDRDTNNEELLVSKLACIFHPTTTVRPD